MRNLAKKRYQELLRSRDTFARAFLRDPNVRGVAIGYRRKDGKTTRQLALRFFVSQKRPISQLRGDMIPSRLPLIQMDGMPHPSAHIKTDVHETGKVRLATAPVCGDAIRVGGEIGTAGLVFLNSLDRVGYVLTCGHVLDPEGNGIQQPIDIEADPPVIGQQPIILPLRRHDMSITTTSDNIDAAVCRVNLPPGTLPQTHDGQIVRQLQDPGYEGAYQMFSRKQGAVVNGKDLDLEALFRIEDLGSSNDWAYLNKIFILRMAAEQGDSGSLLYRELPSGQGVAAVGILVGIFEGHAIFHKVRSILNAFQRYEDIHLQLGVPGDV